ncbi:MAG: hypothetical protein WD066_17250, partial [Planctomycetaceae bacterium]
PRTPLASGAPSSVPMRSFAELAASRREWIEHVLRPWCARAERRELERAELDWADIAGRVDPQATLWFWAWGRFPALVHEGIAGVDETVSVRLRLRDGSTVAGYPDNRLTRAGRLVLLTDAGESEPISIDDIAGVEKVGG